jgi:hypothetical protein
VNVYVSWNATEINLQYLSRYLAGSVDYDTEPGRKKDEKI